MGELVAAQSFDFTIIGAARNTKFKLQAINFKRKEEKTRPESWQNFLSALQYPQVLAKSQQAQTCPAKIVKTQLNTYDKYI